MGERARQRGAQPVGVDGVDAAGAGERARGEVGGGAAEELAAAAAGRGEGCGGLGGAVVG